MTKTRYQTITEDIEKAIAQGELKPGDRISSIREISDQYKVSQITALRVFKELVANGKIIRRDGTGYYVAEPRRLQSGDTIFCAFRPPRRNNDQDNFGNRIYQGILDECLENRFNIYQPRSIINLRGRVPDENGIMELTRDIAEASKVAAILLDMRFSDEMIKRHILPVSSDIPLVIIGRKSTLPLITTSVPMESCGQDAARLALKVQSSEFIVLNGGEIFDSNILCDAFCAELLQTGISPSAIHRINDILQSYQRDQEILEEIRQLLKSAKKRFSIFCASDHYSRVLCQYLSQYELIAGRDFSLISYGGLECAMTGSPSITTIAVNVEKLGGLAIQALLQCGTVPKLSYEVDYKLELNETL